MKSHRCFLLSGLLLHLSAAWGPILEPLKGGGVVPEATTTRNNKDTCQSRSEDEIEERPNATARRYSFTQSLDYRESRRNLDGDIIPRLFISRPLLVDFDVFGVVNPFDTTTAPPASRKVEESRPLSADNGDCNDDEEEDCLIPDEYKLADPQDVSHVLEYLGIRRAKPVESTLQRPVRPARP
jgi:hypothetical protein